MPTPAAAQPAADELLAPEPDRWREFAHGVSFRPPAGFELREHTAEGALVTMSSAPTGVTIRFFIKKNNIPLEADFKLGGRRFHKAAILNVLDIAKKELGMHVPGVTMVVKEGLRRVGNRAGAVIYYRIKHDRHGDWIIGQSFMMIDEKTVALWQMEVDLHRATYGRRVFEAVTDSVQIEDPQRMTQWREKLTLDALDWHEKINPNMMHELLVPEQWFKLHHENRLIGWMRVTQKQVNGWGEDAEQPRPNPRGGGANARPHARVDDPGIEVLINARIHFEQKLVQFREAGRPGQRTGVHTPQSELIGSALDLESRLYLSDDRSQELWSRRISIRPLMVERNALGQVKESRTRADVVHASWAETGIREGDVITVNLQSPQGVKYHEWPVPPRLIKQEVGSKRVGDRVVPEYEVKPGFCYLSQVELWLLERLLPKNKTNEFGFYAYRGPNIFNLPAVNIHAADVKGGLAFRLVRSIPREDGALRIEMYPTLDRVAEIGLYDQLGGLISRTFAGGLRLTPTTPDELAALRTRFK